MDVRMIEKRDIEQVHEIEKNCFSDAWSITGIQESLDQNHTVLLGAWLDRKLSGYVIAYLSIDDCEIARIAVDGTCRRKGVALKLLEELKNEAAVSLYGKFGFTQDGIRKNFYVRPTEDAVLMSFIIGK